MPYTTHPQQAPWPLQILVLTIAYITFEVLSRVEYSRIVHHGQAVRSSNVLLYSLIAAILFAISCCCTVMIVTNARGAIRRRDNIAGDECRDFCLSFWCNPCTQCMLLRHEGLSGDKYNPFTQTGSLAPTQSV